MDSVGLWGAIGAGLAAAAGGAGSLFTYRLGRAKASGTVATTDADALWREAASIRRDYQEQNAALRAEIEKSRQECDEERRELLALIQAQATEIHDLKFDNLRKDERIASLEAARTRDASRINELELELRRRLEAAQAASHPNEGMA